jgi:hypothetical protein
MPAYSARLVVVTNDSTDSYPITPKVQVEFERQFKVGLAKAFQDDVRVEYLYWIAWKASHAAGKVVKPFDSWLDEVVDVQLEDVPTAPFDATASPG